MQPQYWPPLSPEEVKIFRSALQASQTGLATQLGVSSKTIEQWERQGAPGYWRYVFTAIWERRQPWSSQTYVNAVVEQIRHQVTPNKPVYLQLVAINPASGLRELIVKALASLGIPVMQVVEVARITPTPTAPVEVRDMGVQYFVTVTLGQLQRA